jgi:hypothetical protein
MEATLLKFRKTPQITTKKDKKCCVEETPDGLPIGKRFSALIFFAYFLVSRQESRWGLGQSPNVS